MYTAEELCNLNESAVKTIEVIQVKNDDVIVFKKWQPNYYKKIFLISLRSNSKIPKDEKVKFQRPRTWSLKTEQTNPEWLLKGNGLMG